MRIVLFDGSSQWRRESELRQCDESKQRRWDSLLGDLGSIFVAVECCRVGDVFFPSVEYLDPNFGVTHVGIVYCNISSDTSCCQFGDGS